MRLTKKHGSGRHAAIYRTYLRALGRVKMTLALYAHSGIDDIDVAFADGVDRALRQTNSASYAILGYL